MKNTVDKDFVFPGGRIARHAVDSCMDSLETAIESRLSHERIIDFCICQVYAVSGYTQIYRSRWNVSHSFGKKAMERFTRNTKGKRFYEDKWLANFGLSREKLSGLFKSRKEHPLAKFIYPEYEEVTKKRLHSSEVGFYICRISTLLWTPFSPVCRTCRNEQRCKEITSCKYAELYRIRNEEYNRNKE